MLHNENSVSGQDDFTADLTETYNTVDEYHRDLQDRGALPEGFKTGVTSFTFFPEERSIEEPLAMKLSVILLDEPTDAFAGVYTKNSFPGAPVVIGRELLKSKYTAGVIINNKISNVCAPDGIETANAICKAVEAHFNYSDAPVFPASTGIIGWKLPKQNIINAIPEISLSSDSIYEVSKAIMTTDAFPKVRSIKIGGGSICAIAKGAGMIEPNMATMLVYILTDIAIPKEILQPMLKRAIEASFNRITVDSDQSTSDMALLFSSKKVEGVSEADFENALTTVCRQLSEDVVRNGEGTGHVVRISVTGLKSNSLCNEAAKHIANAPLLKCAVFGNDPNVGRILQAFGDWAGNNNVIIDSAKVEIRIGDSLVFHKGAFDIDSRKEDILSDYLKDRALAAEGKTFPEHNKCVEITINSGAADTFGFALGSDLSYEYVRENADYRS